MGASSLARKLERARYAAGVNRSPKLPLLAFAPLLACATGSASSKASSYPTGVERRASCIAAPPASGLAHSEPELLAWLEQGTTEEEPIGPEGMYGGEPCTREMIGELDWSTQRLVFLRGSSGGSIRKLRIRGSTLHVFQEIERQCGGMEMPMFQPGTAVLVVPSQVESVEWNNHSEPCEWQRKGLPPPP